MGVSYNGSIPSEGLAFCVDFSNPGCYKDGEEVEIKDSATVNGSTALEALGLKITIDEIDSNSRPVLYIRSTDYQTKRIYANAGSSNVGFNYSDQSSSYSASITNFNNDSRGDLYIQIPASGEKVFLCTGGNSFADVADLEDPYSIFGHSKITKLIGNNDLVGRYKITKQSENGPALSGMWGFPKNRLLENETLYMFSGQTIDGDGTYDIDITNNAPQSSNIGQGLRMTPDGLLEGSAKLRQQLDGTGYTVTVGSTGVGTQNTPILKEGDLFYESFVQQWFYVGAEIGRDSTFSYHPIGIPGPNDAKNSATIGGNHGVYTALSTLADSTAAYKGVSARSNFICPGIPLPGMNIQVKDLTCNGTGSAQSGFIRWTQVNGTEVSLHPDDFPGMGGEDGTEPVAVIVYSLTTGNQLHWNVINSALGLSGPNTRNLPESGIVTDGSVAYRVMVYSAPDADYYSSLAQTTNGHPVHMKFNGTSDRMFIDDLVYGNNVRRIDEGSMFAWVRSTYDSGSDAWDSSNWAILDFDRSDVFTFALNGGGQIQFSARTNGNGGIGGTYHDIVGNQKVNDGHWHYVGVTRSTANQRIRMWVDGKLDREFIANGSLGYMGRGSTRYGVIGDGSEKESPTDTTPGNNVYYDGDIAAIWLYDEKELSEEEVKKHFLATSRRFGRSI